MRKVLVVCGATASGKTSLAVQCAKKLNTEVISADSMLIYKGLDVGTAKPSMEEREGVTHHLIDEAEVHESFSVSDYETKALPIVERLLAEGKTPVICGGTGFYIQSLLYKSQFGNVGANEELRAHYENLAKEKGNAFVHAILCEKDPESGAKLHENDLKRVIRALEIYDTTGKAKSLQCDEYKPRFPFLAVSIDYPRETLYERINLRVEQMFEQGLMQEVQNLLLNGLDKSCQCMQGIGYKEVVQGIEEGWTEEEIKELIKKNTRNYAKRQLTYFKRMENHIKLTPKQATAECVLQLLEENE